MPINTWTVDYRLVFTVQPLALFYIIFKVVMRDKLFVLFLIFNMLLIKIVLILVHPLLMRSMSGLNVDNVPVLMRVIRLFLSFPESVLNFYFLNLKKFPELRVFLHFP